MKIGILKYPGGHGDSELEQALRQYFRKEVVEVWYRKSIPADLDIIFLGGGFPCVGLDLDTDCLDQSEALRSLPAFAEKGKYVVGFGNGFRFLCDAGFLPGSLSKNADGRFVCKKVFLKPENKSSAFTRRLDEDSLFNLPMATEYGRYLAGEDDLMKMRRDGRILFRFCDNGGRITESVNYTGSMDNIAGICNPGKNVFGMIPQPERDVIAGGYKSDGSVLLEAFLSEIMDNNKSR